MIALTEKKCKVGNISSIVDFKNIICRDTCALRETLALCGMKCCNSALIKFLFANLFSSPCAFLQAPITRSRQMQAQDQSLKGFTVISYVGTFRTCLLLEDEQRFKFGGIDNCEI